MANAVPRPGPEEVAMSNAEGIRREIEPVRTSVKVACSVEHAFEVFTSRLDTWWPKHTHSVSRERTSGVAIEPGVGGEVYEVRDDGQRSAWGRILAWEAPQRFVMTWHPGRAPEAAQEVEVRFVADGDGTRVELEHRNWAALGAEAETTRNNYAGGWATVLSQHFAPACGRQQEA